jgi:hypothetical protein
MFLDILFPGYIANDRNAVAKITFYELVIL